MSDDDVSEEFLVEVVKRGPLFELLDDGPREMNELVENLDMSRSTVHRTIQSFVEKGLLAESEDGVELTGLGHKIGDEVLDFRTRVESASRLQAFLNTVEPTDVDVPTGRFADAEVVHPKPRQPHFAVKRIIELIEASNSVRILSTVISPFYVDVAYREMLDGTEIEVVFDQHVVEIVTSEYADKATRAARTGEFDVYVHDDVPFELFVFDDCVGMAAHDENGIARIFVEADASRAVSWAENVYESYRQQADQIDVDAF